MGHISESVAGFIGGNTLGNLGAPVGPTSGGPTTGQVLSKFFDAQGNQLFVDEIANQQFVQDANGIFYVPRFDGRGQFQGVELASASQQDIINEALNPTAPAGRAPPSFGSTQAAQTQAETFAREQAAILAQARKDELAVAEAQAELDRLIGERETKLGIARDIIAQKEASAREARGQGLEFAGEDIFRFTAGIRGGRVASGVHTPADVFRGELQRAGSFQAPDLQQFAGGQTAGELGVDIDALDSVLAKLGTDQGVPTSFGFAHGGTLSPGGVLGGGGGDGSQAVRIGEEGPEILILRPDGSVEVVPMAGSAAHGGRFSAESLGGFQSLFQNLRSSVGLQPGALTASTGRGILSDTARSRLGIAPRGFEPQITGRAPAFQAIGRSLTNVKPGAFQALRAAHPNLSRQDARAQALQLQRTIGLLPAPHKIPPLFFAGLVPAEQKALVSAYRFAGFPESDFRHLLTVTQLSANPVAATAVG
jgi:hypothetical protein